MRQACRRLAGALGLAAVSTAFAASCSAPLRPKVDAYPPAQALSPAPATQLAQLEFGRNAAYASCLPPACPAVTPKTLASDVPSVAVPPRASDVPSVAVPPRAIDATASLSAGEELVSLAARRKVPAVPVAAINGAGAVEPDSRQVTVRFAFGSAVLSYVAQGQIDATVKDLDANSRLARVAIAGRTDSVGPPQVNQALALARAHAVRDHLRIRHPQLSAAVALDAEGACCYAAPNETANGRALNRRVEIAFERDAKDL